MTIERRWQHALAALALLAFIVPGCKRPTEEKKARRVGEARPVEKGPAPLEAPEGPEVTPPPAPDEDILLDDPDVGFPEILPEVAPSAGTAQEEAPGEEAIDDDAWARPRDPSAAKTRRDDKAAAEDDLRTPLLRMRRSVDRRLLWARRLQERTATLEARSVEILALEKSWELVKRVPDAPEVDALGALLAKSADAAGLPLTGLTFELSGPDEARLPEFFTGNKPFTLTEADLVGTVHVGFFLNTQDKARLTSWIMTLPTLSRFVIVNRIRYTGETYHVLADAYYLSTRTGPTRREELPDINTELKQVGITDAVDAVRMQDPEHFFLATEMSLRELRLLHEEANRLSALESMIQRREAIHTWYQRRLKARTGLSVERILR